MRGISVVPDGDLIAFRRLSKVLNYRSGVALSPATAQRHLGTSTQLRREAVERLKLAEIPASKVMLDRAGPAGPNWEASCFEEVADIAPMPGIDNRSAAKLAFELSTAERIGVLIRCQSEVGWVICPPR
jgi:hypothetical protein